MTLRIFCFMLFCLSFFSSFAQCEKFGAQLEQLKQELHLDSQKMPIRDYIKLDSGFIFELDFDTTVMVRSQQPDHAKVTAILRELMNCPKDQLFDPLWDVYQLYLDKFDEEWGDLKRKNDYLNLPTLEQFGILSSFEVVLKSYHIQDKTPKEQFDFYLNEKFALVSARDQERVRLADKFLLFSPRYRSKLDGNIFALGIVDFSYIEPYLDDIKPYLKEYIFSRDYSPDKGGLPNDEARTAIWEFELLMDEKDEDVINFIYSHFDRWYVFYRHDFMFIYGKNFYDESLSNFLVSKWVETSKEDLLRSKYTDRPIGNMLFEDERNLQIALDRVFKYGSDKPMEAIDLLKFLPNPAVKLYYLEQLGNPKSDKPFLQKIKTDLHYKG